MRLRSLAVFAVIIAFVVADSGAQRVAERVDVTVIEVPVTVADRSGNSIRGLTKENFELQVDGKRVPIEYFEVVDLTTVTAASERRDQPLPAAAYRNFLLLFDVANSSPGTIGRAREAAKQFVETQMGERDLAAVSTFTSEQGARMVTSFTRNRELLIKAIETLGDVNYFKVGDPLLLSEQRQPASTASVRADVEDAKLEERKELNQQTSHAHANEMRNRIRIQVQNFGTVARALDGLRGQKQVILLSEGFDASLLTGRQDLSVAATQAETNAVLSGEVWKVDSDKRYGTTREANDITQMAELFRRSDVRLHAIDIKGVRSDVDAREGVRKSSNEGLFLLTNPTGGTVVRNANDLSSQFGELMRRQEVIYLLGFRAPQTNSPGKFHPVRVRLSGAKGELTHRSGFYETGAQNQLEATLTLSEMLMTMREVADIPLSVAATAVPGADDARVPIVIDSPGAAMLQGTTSDAVNVQLFVYAFDDKGQVRDYMQQRVNLDLSKTGGAVRATGLRYLGALRLPPGDYDVKALVRVDETGRTGLATARLTVPAFGANAVLTPVAAEPPGAWVTLVSPTRGSDATSILTLGDRPFVARRRANVALGTEQEVALMFRGIPADKLTVTPNLVAGDGSVQEGNVELVGRTAPDDQGLYKLLYRFKPEALARGEYELRFTVVPQGSMPSVVMLPVTIR
jgi:VWFA-related protein